MIRQNAVILAIVALAASTQVAPAGPSLEIVTATYFGVGQDSDLQGAAIAPDGTIYVVGNSSEAMKGLPGGVIATAFGAAANEARCGSGFVAHLTADGKTILQCAQLAPGIALLTTVQLHDGAVYVSGYGSVGLEDVLRDRKGMMRQFPLNNELHAYERAKAAGAEDKIADRPGLGRYGAPCILRLSADLQKLDAGTYLEGWQQVWDKKRVAKPGKEFLGGYQEYFWQPTSTAVLKSGDIIVCHDGGYFRMAREEDKTLLKDDPKPDRLIFYDNCDYISRLSADLGRRLWKQSIYTPPVDPEVARKLKNGWPFNHYGSPRTCRMRLDRDDNAYLCGWSASATSKEPWWSPYLYKLDPATGAPIWTAYEYDPMSGGQNRMGGQVADTAIDSLAIDEDGNLLTSLMSDGGNSVMEWSPKADRSKFEGKIKGGGFPVKLVHWWGQIHRVDSKTREGRGGARIGAWGWAQDLVSLPGNSVLVWGRYNWKFDFTPDAWWDRSAIENPNAFIRVYSPDFDLLFSTAVPGVVPFEVTRAANRIVLVGRAEQRISPTKDAIFPESSGNTSGYLLVANWNGNGPK